LFAKTKRKEAPKKVQKNIHKKQKKHQSIVPKEKFTGKKKVWLVEMESEELMCPQFTYSWSTCSQIPEKRFPITRLDEENIRELKTNFPYILVQVLVIALTTI
jgi:hypothetical protein